MKKLWIIMTLGASLCAMEFPAFKALALERSPRLASFAMQSAIARKEGDISLMYGNPELEIEAGRFTPERGDAGNGWRAAVAQPFRVPGLGSDLEAQRSANVAVAKASLLRGRAGFVAALERAWTEYVYARGLKSVAEEEARIAARFEMMAKTRFENGAATRAQRLQATAEKLSVHNRVLALAQREEQAFYRLLSLAGITEEVALEGGFLYPVEAAASAPLKSPDIALQRQKSTALKTQARAEDHALRNWTLYGEYENEPNQAIARIGFSAALPFFNVQKERASLSRLRARRTELESLGTQRAQRVHHRALERLIAADVRRDAALRRLQKEQKRLLELFEEGYRLSGTSLLDLLLAKSRLIETKRTRLAVRREANLARIEMNYLEGKYND